MKAAVVYANEDVRYETVKDPEVTPGSVKVRVRASGICGSDVPRVLNHGVHFYPIILGHEFAGDVVETGENVKNIKVGDRVSGVPLMPCMSCPDCRKGNYSLCKNYSFIGSRRNGSNAEYIVIPEQNAVVFNKNIPYEQGAMFEPATVALHGVFDSRYRGGYTAAVLGAGTIGIFTMQWAKIFGAEKVTVFDINEDKLKLAKELGADETVCMKGKNLKNIQERYDYVFEAAGQPQTIRQAFYIAANKAHICFIGTPNEALTFDKDVWELINRKELMMTGSWMSYSAPFPGKEWEMTAHCLASGRLKFDRKFIGHKFLMSEAQQAFMMFKTPEKIKGKVMLYNCREDINDTDSNT